jgi:hypothetical protein
LTAAETLTSRDMLKITFKFFLYSIIKCRLVLSVRAWKHWELFALYAMTCTVGGRVEVELPVCGPYSFTGNTFI